MQLQHLTTSTCYDHECNRGTKQRRAATRSTSNHENKKKIIFKFTINTCNISHFQCNMFIDSRSHTQASENEIKYRLVEDKGRCEENVSSTNSIKTQNHNIAPCVEVTTFHFMWKAYHSTLCGKHMSTLCGQKFFYPPCVGRKFCFNNYLYHYQNNTYQKKSITEQ
jgi:hypothetical protein